MHYIQTIFILLFLLISALKGNTQSFTFEHKGEIQNLQERMTLKKINGMCMQIYRNGNLDTTILMGYADKEKQVKVNEHTLFQIGAMSIAIGNFVLLKAVAQGKVKLENNVNDYLRSWKLQTLENQVVTVEQIVMHTCNFAERDKPKGYKIGKKVPTLLQILKGEKPSMYKAIKLLPGENPYSFDDYSSTLVLQQLLEDIYQIPYTQIVEKEVFEPLGMKESFVQLVLSPEQKKRAATGYTHEGKRIKGDYHQHPEAISSGVWSTTSDYAKFVLHIYAAAKGENNTLISKELALKAIQMEAGKKRALLFGVGDKENNYLGGASYGFRTQFEGNVETKNLVVIFLNSHENWQFLNIDMLSAAFKYIEQKNQPK